jgi:anti-sigma28 factor (negative regulator of flagellin synthesis)
MSTINNISSNDPVQQLANRPIQRTVPADSTDTTATPAPADRLELSGVSYLVQSLQTNNVRTDLVSNVRAQIDAGTYEDDNKLNVTVDKLLNDLTNG